MKKISLLIALTMLSLNVFAMGSACYIQNIDPNGQASNEFCSKYTELLDIDTLLSLEQVCKEQNGAWLANCPRGGTTAYCVFQNMTDLNPKTTWYGMSQNFINTMKDFCEADGGLWVVE